eukprot:4714547-Pyramimonas_sp.AAC.1
MATLCHGLRGPQARYATSEKRALTRGLAQEAYTQMSPQFLRRPFRTSRVVHKVWGNQQVRMITLLSGPFPGVVLTRISRRGQRWRRGPPMRPEKAKARQWQRYRHLFLAVRVRG